MPRRQRTHVTGEPGLRRHQTLHGARLFQLNREHEKLAREIRQKEQRLRDVRALRSEVDTRFAIELEPLQRQVLGVVTEIRDLFVRLLGSEGQLSRREKVAVRKYSVAFEADFEWIAESQLQAPRGDDHVRAKSSPPRPSAQKPDPERERTLHTLFRRLVVVLHPDKVQDAVEKDARTELLKEVTQAYETSDLARLLELEGVHLAQAPIREDEHYVSRRIQELTASNVELRRQLKVVSRQLRDAKGGLLDGGSADVASREDMTQAMASRVVKTWRVLAERLAATRHLLDELVLGKTSALGFLDGSWRTTVTRTVDDVTHESSVPTAPHQVDESNVESVLEAFKQQLDRARRRRS